MMTVAVNVTRHDMCLSLVIIVGATFIHYTLYKLVSLWDGLYQRSSPHFAISLVFLKAENILVLTDIQFLTTLSNHFQVKLLYIVSEVY